ncbi:MAG: hypothetical protein PHN82_12190 [bacterium]|nr:hypothetical protein [bacterium]
MPPTCRNVRFPVPGMGSAGAITFRAPGGATGRWAFVAALVRQDDGRFPADPPVEVSNSFMIR